ncbi:MAG TPA: glutathione S-transferase [Ideonella sp.]|uniref:glutathione S-transferase family protein n=1 Tax=Ideonella sp. TaxID=1929293 RepID=UPI002CEC5920|nr:glutathione S-transferase [Ideonella sp.]HSI48651.1 glutathione S-transferase [Ideonella sp.]
MQLIGMLDSPYVRRVAVSLQLLQLPFEHRSVSVFRGFDAFGQINPVVKAPTLVCDDGTVLMDSTLILDYAEALAAPRSLMPAALPARQQALHLIGLALAATEKSVQIVYEHGIRPAEKVHAPWLERVTGQMHSAFGLLEAALAPQSPQAKLLSLASGELQQAGITLAVAAHFAQQMQPEQVHAERYPRLAAWSAQAEQLPAFRAAAHGEGVYPVKGA